MAVLPGFIIEIAELAEGTLQLARTLPRLVGGRSLTLFSEVQEHRGRRNCQR